MSSDPGPEDLATCYLIHRVLDSWRHYFRVHEQVKVKGKHRRCDVLLVPDDEEIRRAGINAIVIEVKATWVDGRTRKALKQVLGYAGCEYEVGDRTYRPNIAMIYGYPEFRAHPLLSAVYGGLIYTPRYKVEACGEIKVTEHSDRGADARLVLKEAEESLGRLDLDVDRLETIPAQLRLARELEIRKAEERVRARW